MVTSKLKTGNNPAMDKHSTQGNTDILQVASCSVTILRWGWGEEERNNSDFGQDCTFNISISIQQVMKIVVSRNKIRCATEKAGNWY